MHGGHTVALLFFAGGGAGPAPLVGPAWFAPGRSRLWRALKRSRLFQAPGRSRLWRAMKRM